METPGTPTTAPSTSVLFEDGIGKRHFTTGPAGEPLDVLVLSEELTSVSSFEAALRARPAQLAQFQHPAFSRVRGLVRLGKGQRLGIVSDHVDGKRLAELLAVAEQQLVPLPFDAAVWVIREMVTAISALHNAMPDGCHGAIAPERILVTPESGVMIADYVLGSALEQLRFSPERHWKELRIALLPAIGHPRFDERADLVQMGTTALALTLGRPLRDTEDPSMHPALLGDARALSLNGELAALPPGLRAWLSRVLQLVPQKSFSTCSDALRDLNSQSGMPDQTAGKDAFKTFVAACAGAVNHAARAGARVALPAATVSSPPQAAAAPAAAPPAPVSIATKDMPAETKAAAETKSVPETKPAAEPAPAMASVAVAEADDAPTRVEERGPFRGPARPRGEARRAALMIAVTRHARAFGIGAAALVVMSLAGVAAHMYASTPAAVAATGTLVVTTDPVGAPVVIDGRQSGKTPVTLALAAGEHVMVLGNGEPRTVHLKIAPGAQMSQFYQLKEAARPAVGQLQVRSDPAGAKVVVDGTSRGVAPLTVDGLAPGTHVVLLENDLGSVKESVQVEAGGTASLVVPMTAPKGAQLSGWISVDSTGDVQLFENQQLLGSNKIERIMLPVGRHDLQIVNDGLGFRSSRSVEITAGQVTHIKVEWPMGTLALNALPWADAWVDGQRVGQTPMANIQVPIGVHDIVFRHPELGEQHFKATVTFGQTARVSADLRKK